MNGNNNQHQQNKESEDEDDNEDNNKPKQHIQDVENNGHEQPEADNGNAANVPADVTD